MRQIINLENEIKENEAVKLTSEYLHDEKNSLAYITGVGVSSPAGCSLDHIWNQLNAGYRPAAYPIKSAEQDEKVYTNVNCFKKYEKPYENYFLDMCCDTIYDAIQDSGVNIRQKKGCIIVGTGMGLADSFLYGSLPVDFMSQLPHKIQKRLSTDIKIMLMANACCAGAQAIVYGADLVNAGMYDYVIAGGVEAFFYITYCGFERL